jgi:hypothetical protein
MSITKEEFSNMLKAGNYTPEFKDFLEKTTIKYIEEKFPWLMGQFKCRVDGTTGYIEKIARGK